MERQRWIYEHCNYRLGPSSCWISELCLGEEAQKHQSCVKGLGQTHSKNPISERKEALQKLEKIQLEMEESEITPTLLEREQKAQYNSFQAFRREQEYWRLKS